MELSGGTERPEHGWTVSCLLTSPRMAGAGAGAGWRELSQVPKSSLTVEAWQEVRGCQRLRGQRRCGQVASKVQGLLGAPVRVVPGMLPVRLHLELSSLVSRGVGPMETSHRSAVSFYGGSKRKKAGRQEGVASLLPRGIEALGFLMTPSP